MAFTDALQDTATFYTTSVSRSSIGEEVKSQAALYSGIRCRIHKTQSSPKNMGGPQEGAFQKYKNQWVLLVETAYNGADRGDKVVVNSENYLIVRKQSMKGVTSTPNHIAYYLEENNG